MDYEGKFRDFLVGWLADQLDQANVKREELAAFYHTVVGAARDSEALAEVEVALGNWASRLLWNLSRRWDDPSVAMSRELIGALRDRVYEDYQDPTMFYLFFLNPFAEGWGPDSFEEICWLLRVFYTTVAETVLTPQGWEPYVVVEPSAEDASNVVVLAYPRDDFQHKVFLLQAWYKVWRLRFTNPVNLAEELLALRQAIKQSAARAIPRKEVSDEHQ